MSACQHRSTTFSREICPDPCGVMHTFCTHCSAMVDDCALTGYVANPGTVSPGATPAERAAADELTRELDTVYGAKVDSASGGGVHGQTTAEGPNRSETTAVDASPELAALILRAKLETEIAHARLNNYSDAETVGILGAKVDRLLAAERAAIHARYEAVAVKCDREARSRSHYAKVDPTYRLSVIPYEVSAEWIRQVAAQ